MEHDERIDRLQEQVDRRQMETEKILFVRELRRRQKRRWISAVVFIALIASTIYFTMLAKVSTTLVFGILGAGAAVLGSFVYLQSSAGQVDWASESHKAHEMRAYVDARIVIALNELRGPDYKSLEFSDNEKATVLKNIESTLESEFLADYADGIKELIVSQVREETLERHIEATKRRLIREIQDLSRRGNLNLILGITTTLSGLGVLGYAVFNSPISSNYTELLAHFVPRVSLVLLIEVFAYFFLKLYKQSLGEIKYFQNELTNVESKHLAFEIAVRDGDQGLRSLIVEELAKTERNFVLSKDQTTVELERERISRDTNLGLADSIKQLLKKKD